MNWQAANDRSEVKRFTLLAALYLSQGLPYGFFTQALPVLLRKANMSLPMIGLATLLTLPWALKFLWAPLVDRIQIRDWGLRRSWLIPIQISSVILFIYIGFFTPSENLPLVMWAFLFSNFLAAAQDVATDGLAVDLLNQKDRGWANGIQVAGYRVGMIIGGGALLAIYDQLRWSGVMFTMASLALLCTIPVLFFREPARAPLVPRSRIAIFEIFHFFRKPGAWAWAVILLLYKFGHGAAVGMLRPWLVDLEYSMTDIAWILGSAGFVSGFAGAVVGGGLASRFTSRRPSLLIALGGLQALAVLTYLWPLATAPQVTKIFLAAAFDHFASGMATTVLFTLMMDASSRERAAADYTLQACLVVISQQASATFSGLIAGASGYSANFTLSALIAVGSVVVTAALLRLNSVRSLVRTAAAAGAIMVVFLGSASAFAETSGLTGKNAYDLGLQTGVMLSKGVTGLTELVPGWGLKASAPSKYGIVEGGLFLGRGNGETYSALSTDYRIDLEIEDSQTAHFLLGAHLDSYTPIGLASKIAFGWHLGGGFIVPLAGTLYARADFRYRFTPGQSAEILVGFNYRVPTASR